MLGITGSIPRWRWAAYGKHPVSGDYFRLGVECPVSVFFADWMEKGYPVPGGKERPVSSLRIWRFWARGEKGGNLICGFVRDSNDSFGRPYPLLIIGSGPVDSWNKHWDLVPCVCEKTWSYIEYNSTKTLHDLKQLEGEIQNTPAPQPDWIDYRESISVVRDPIPTAKKDSMSSVPIRDPMVSLYQGIDYEVFLINTEFTESKVDSIVILHHSLKDRLNTVPYAIFIGGSFKATYVVCFKRPLQYSDFSVLWSVPGMVPE